jgi:hypothetical protein
MDPKKRKSLVKSLAVAKNFISEYTEPNFRWFIDKVIRGFEGQSPTPSDSEIEQKTRQVIQKAKAVVAAKRDFKADLPLNKKNSATERANRSRRVEILYGLIGFNPDLVETANQGLLEFIAKRRYRTIGRMQFFVNPNGRGYFRYPDTCESNFDHGHYHWRVNESAKTHWEPLVTNQDVPIWMKKPPDPPNTFDPVVAIGKLFKSEKDPCEGNLLDCATTMNVVLMDSLLEASDPKTFLNELANRGPIYLSIVHVNPPVGPQPEGFFLIDPSPNALFAKGTVPQEDLQIGDHVYIRNHQLYQTLLPAGSWRGEHALLTDCGNRKLDSDKGYKFMGHGMPHGGVTGSIPRFYKGLLSEINTLLYRCYRIAGIFLFYMKSNKTSIPANKVQHQQQTLTDPNGVSLTVDFYFFDVAFSYNDFDSKPPPGKKVATKSEHGFVVAHCVSTSQFFLHHRKTIAKAIADGVFDKRAGILFERTNPPSPGEELYDPVEWNLIFIDTDGQTALNYELFAKKGNTTKMVPLEMWELYTEPLARPDPNKPDEVATTRPKVDTSAAYISFLTAKKAL